MGWFKLDWHTPTHLLGSFFLVHLLQFFGLSLIVSIGVAFTLGVIWEILDEEFYGKWIFDKRGGDFTDIIVDAIGCILAIWI